MNDLQTQSFDVESVKQGMLASLNYFSAVAYPEGHLKDFSPLHCNIWEELTSATQVTDAITKHAIGIPRGHAKTQLLKFLVLYSILFTEKSFILVVCNTATLAQNLISDVMDMLVSPNIVALFGDVRRDMEVDSKELKKFRFLDKRVVLKPMGASSATRGISINNRRPDVIICDDMQSLEEARSPEVSKHLLQWFLGTLLKARSPAHCSIIYVGNMYPDLEIGERGSGIYACILRNLQNSSEWLSWVVGAILEDGTALWEEVISKEQLLSDLAQDSQMGQPEVFFAEVMNDPRAAASRFFNAAKIPEFPYTEGEDLILGKYLVIDPSLGKKKSDEQIVGLFYVYDHKGPVLQELRNYQCSAPKLVESVIVWALEERVPLVVSESVAYQATLIQWFIFYLELLQVEGIQCAGVSPNSTVKATRILLALKAWMSGSIFVSKKARSAVVSQAQVYVPTSANNVDDVLDVLAYGESVYLNYSHMYTVDLELDQLNNSKPTESSDKKDITNMSTGLNEFLEGDYDPYQS